MSAKRHPQPLKPARSVGELSDPTVIHVDFPSGAAEAVAEATSIIITFVRERPRSHYRHGCCHARARFLKTKKKMERAW
jgi:hypothetical protein